MRKPSILLQTLAWFGLVLAIFAALLGASLWRFSQLAESRSWALRTRQVIEKADAMLIDVLSIETGARGFAITGDEDFLEPLAAGTGSLRKDYAALKVLITDNQDLLRLAALREQIQKWRSSEIDPLVALRREINQGRAPERLIGEFISSEVGRRQMEAMQATLASIKAEEKSLLMTRQEALSEGDARLRGMLLWGGAAAMVAGMLIAFLTAKRLRKSSQALLDELSLRRRREAQLTQSEELAQRRAAELDASLEAVADALFVFGLDKGIVRMNAAAEQLFGYTPQERALPVWQRLASVRVTSSAGKTLALEDLPGFRALMSGETAKGEELRFERRGRSPFWASVSAAPIHDNTGAVIGSVSTFRDITERKENEAALRHSEELFRNIYNASANLIAITTLREGRVIEINDAFTTLLGYTRQEIVGKTALDGLWVDKEDRKRLVQRLETGGRFDNEEVRLRAKTGGIKTVLMSSSLTDINGEQCLVTSVSDITERRQAEQALRESESRLRLALDASKAGAWEWDVRTGENIWSEELWNLYGLAPHSRKPSYESWLESIHPDDRARAGQAVREAASRGEEINLEWRVNAPAGEERWLLSRGRPLLDADGRVVRYLGIVLDITAQKELETSLRKAKEEWEQTFASVPDLIAIMDDQYRVVRVNKAMAERLGCSPEQCAGLPCYQAVHGLDAPPSFCPYAKMLADGREHTAELYEERLGGYFLVSATPLHDDQGRITGSVHVARDITERKRAEEEARSLAKFPEENPNPVLRVARNGMVLYANQASEPLLRHWGAGVGQPLPSDFQKLIESVLAQQRVDQTESELPGRTYALFWAPIAGEEYVNVYGLDITERKRAEEALERQTESLELQVQERTEELRQAKEEVESDLRVMNRLQAISALLVSEEGLQSILGKALDVAIDLTGADMGNIQLLDPESDCLKIVEHRGFKQVFLDFWNNVREGQGTCGMAKERRERVIVEDVAKSHIFVGKPAFDVQMEAGVQAVQSTPLVSRSGVMLGALSTHHGSTHSWDQRSQRALDLLARQLADIIELKDAAKTLRLAKEEAEAANRAKSEFLANMSHEIRTPMNGIMGMIELAHMSCRDTRPREYLGYAKKSAVNLLDIVNDILDLSKIEAGRMELETGVFRPREMLENLFATQGYQAEQKGLRFSAHVDQNVPERLVGDEGRLRQIYTNLVGNAVKYTRQGEVAVHVTAEILEQGPAQGVRGRPGPVSLIASIRDTGIGIAPDKLSRIFEPFTRGSQDAEFGGTGLGLTITRQLVELMHGRIDVRSTLGQGSTFTVSVLLQAAPQEAIPAEPLGGGIAQGRAKPLKILLAEDNEINRFLAVELLKERGHEVVTADNGKRALEALARDSFDLVLMDAQMPVMDGVEATRRIRAGEVPGVDPRIPVVALTAYALKGDRERFIEADMDDYLSKPIDLEDLEHVLARIAAGGRSAE